MENKQEKRNKRFLVGVIIIAVSFALGWPVLFLTATMGAIFGHFWFILGGIIYAISWIMLGFGTLLAGAEGVKFFKAWMRTRVFRKKAANNEKGKRLFLL